MKLQGNCKLIEELCNCGLNSIFFILRNEPISDNSGFWILFRESLLSISISKHDVALIYTGLLLVFILLFGGWVFLIFPLGFLTYSYWHTTVRKDSSYLLKSFKVIFYMYILYAALVICVFSYAVYDFVIGSSIVQMMGYDYLIGGFLFVLALLVVPFLIFKFMLFVPITKNLEYITEFGIFKGFLIPTPKSKPKSIKFKGRSSELNNLEHWFSLYEKGAITKEEYEVKKASILDSKNMY